VSDAASPEESVIVAYESFVQRQRLREALSVLDDRERRIIEERILQEDAGATLGDLGVLLGVSRERVRQLEARALRKMHARWVAA
jgi:RNA polymerase sigma-32 factor